jgi:hypothetical protein
VQCTKVSRQSTFQVTTHAEVATWPFLQGKCPRAFHVTCAIHNPDVSFSEYEVDEWVPVPMAEGQTVPRYELAKTLRTELLCPQHNPVGLVARTCLWWS